MGYKENPKTKGSGILGAIPQSGTCPVRCEDCFFQSGRSYLEPLAQNLPNMPEPEDAIGRVVRMNDGNDSNNRRSLVISASRQYDDVFFNTSIPRDLHGFPGPVVLTANPGDMTDTEFHAVDPCPLNMMFVRARTNMWNLDLIDRVVDHYGAQDIPVVLTFMAYYTSGVRAGYEEHYEYRQRTMNSYWVLRQDAWDAVVQRYKGEPLVYTCGKDAETHSCARCGNCLREYFRAKESMRGTRP